MNREQYKTYVKEQRMMLHDEPDGDDLVDLIFDDFESRTCGNCEHYKIVMPQNNPHDQFNYIDCCANDAGMNVVSCPPMDFGCNKWEQKK
jgi:hypothetical protein